MKMLKIFLMLACCTCVFSLDDIQKIYQKAAELIESNHSEKEEEEILFEFYSQEIAKLDLETLKKNPELILRKAFAWEEMMGSLESVQEILNQMALLQNDYKFIMEHSEERSKLFASAQFRYALDDYILKKSPKSIEELMDSFQLFIETFTQQWAANNWGTNPLSTGKTLREEIISNVERFPDIAASFWDFVFHLTGDPDLALGYIQPDEVRIKGIVFDDKGRAKLLCIIKYQIQNTKYSFKTSL